MCRRVALTIHISEEYIAYIFSVKLTNELRTS
jgi:hypothetical protein